MSLFLVTRVSVRFVYCDFVFWHTWNVCASREWTEKKRKKLCTRIGGTRLAWARANLDRLLFFFSFCLVLCLRRSGRTTWKLLFVRTPFHKFNFYYATIYEFMNEERAQDRSNERNIHFYLPPTILVCWMWKLAGSVVLLNSSEKWEQK